MTGSLTRNITIAETAQEVAAALAAPLQTAATAYVEAHGGGEGRFSTPMRGVHLMRAFREKIPPQEIYKPSLCVVIQGAKQLVFGDDTLDYGAMECLIVSVELPASGRVTRASAETPFLGVNIELDTSMVREVLQQLPSARVDSEATALGAFVGKVDAALADAVLRLIRIADTPEAVPILYPAAMREICYRLLTGPHGDHLRKLALPGTHAQRIAKAIYLLRDHFNQTLSVDQLAEASRMSASSFHQHFKALTSMTPIQYQKQLRLLEARRMMVMEAAKVGEAAYQVGYESPSQFSRDYARMFGAAPKRDVASARSSWPTRPAERRDRPTARCGPSKNAT
ncbi:AraC family transcriptional regulator [Phenylobacterium deserti]|uniref:AraC family transcriptional regulator n=1 Tax=Phenylobacterium deserti TaxID=1914756 RepID=A0A328AIK5_9CAUL|nr:AraC family transcriptional regulator [Phenylobacterium deserti]RAK52678.1 AraC family transcriptional regulator [Phenylobacterium deserti]